MLHKASDLDRFFGTTKAMETDMKFGICSVMSLYTTGSLKTAASELAKCNLALVAV
jgi:hypothetical protein